MTLQERRVLTGCAHDCGGKCLLVAHVRDGRVVRVTGEPEAVRRHHIEPCVRGLRYEARVHSPDRLTRPLVRRGPRGSAEFREVSWNEALGTVADRLAEIRAASGPGAFLCMGRSGSYTCLFHETRLASQRFFNLAGGHLGMTGNYSNGAAGPATLHTYGTANTGHSRSDLLHSQFVLIWGWDPLVTRFGSHTARMLRECRHRGIPLVVVDPRRSETARLADRWIPIRPGSDVALLSAMGRELIVHGRHDDAFVRRAAVGYEAYRDYLLGASDGVPKTPEWQEPITGVPAATCRWLAMEYGTRRPAALMPGWGPQRSRQGEQFHRATAALATLAGYVGVPGGSAGGIDRGSGPQGQAQLPPTRNPYGETIPIYRWADCVLRGPAGGYPSQPRCVYLCGGNPLGQHPDANKTRRALEHLELLVVHEQFLTPTARYADVLLPATTFMERNDILQPYDGIGSFFLYQHQAIPPVGLCRNDFDVYAELAERLGFGAAYTEGRDEDTWLRSIAAKAGIADYDAFRERGIHWTAPPGPEGNPEPEHVALQDEAAGRRPFPTPSGRIELYSERLARRGDPLVPPVPQYLDHDDGPTDPGRARFPLQLLSPKSRWRTNSTLDNVLDADQRVTLHPADAAALGLAGAAGRLVRVWNERGSCVVPLRIGDDVAPGVAVLPSGSWVRWDERGHDVGGCPNTLTSDAGTAWGRSSIQQSVLVAVEPAWGRQGAGDVRSARRG